MSKYSTYEQIKKQVLTKGGAVGSYKEINYGIQFDVTYQGLTSKVRVYESKKKGVTVDLSQVKHEEIKAILLDREVPESSAGTTGYKSDQMQASLIGVDESGKGDYFGPLVIGAVYADEAMKKQLMQLGVMDSKKLTDTHIAQMAQTIRTLCPHEVLVIANPSYNKLYDRIQNLNILLAKGHAKVIETLAKKTSCQLALSDQFGNEKLIKEQLKQYNLELTLEQRPKGESNIVVAAASILARDAFVEEMNRLSQAYGQTFPKGAGPATVTAAKKYVASFGKAGLVDVAKLHFKTTQVL